MHARLLLTEIKNFNHVHRKYLELKMKCNNDKICTCYLTHKDSIAFASYSHESTLLLRQFEFYAPTKIKEFVGDTRQ